MTFDATAGAESARYRYVTDVRGSVRPVVNADTDGQRPSDDARGELGFRLLAPRLQPALRASAPPREPCSPAAHRARDYDPHSGCWTAKDPVRC